MTTGKNHSFDYMDLIALFFNTVYVCHRFPFKEQALFNFVTVVTVPSDFGAPVTVSIILAQNNCA